jgi:drug/metabolite transporter (DMT)-like permease
VVLWGANNTGLKYLVGSWPPIGVGCSRFLCAGFMILALMHWTNWLGAPTPLTSLEKKQLWFRTSLVLAVYIIAFNCAVKWTAVSHVALYLGASPIWALILDRHWDKSWATVQRLSAAVMAFSGVLILFWPALKDSHANLIGELTAFVGSFLWSFYGRQCRITGSRLPGLELTGQTMWRAGVWLMPLAIWETGLKTWEWRPILAWIQLYCIVGGGVIAFALWNNALRHWPTSKVYLFNNLIPISTTTWAHFCLGEPITHTFLFAMILVVGAVVLAQADFKKMRELFSWPPE